MLTMFPLLDKAITPNVMLSVCQSVSNRFSILAKVANNNRKTTTKWRNKTSSQAAYGLAKSPKWPYRCFIWKGKLVSMAANDESGATENGSESGGEKIKWKINIPIQWNNGRLNANATRLVTLWSCLLLNLGWTSLHLNQSRKNF